MHTFVKIRCLVSVFLFFASFFSASFIWSWGWDSSVGTNGRGDSWLELFKVISSIPSRSIGRMFFFRVNWQCLLLFWYPFNHGVTAVAFNRLPSVQSTGELIFLIMGSRFIPGQHSEPSSTLLVKGVCVSSCWLHSGLFTKWPGSFRCCHGNTGMEQKWK